MSPLPTRLEKVVSFVSLEKLMQLISVIMPSGRWLKEVHWENRIFPDGRNMTYLSLEWADPTTPRSNTILVG